MTQAHSPDAARRHPFPAPERLPPDLDRVRAYWRGLLRGSATIPFWDDVKLIDLPDLAERLFLVDAFEKPERFRLNYVGEAIGENLAGLFADETDLASPLDYLRAQCATTIECRAPTLHRQAGDQAYERLILPLWGEGHISMLLGAVAFA